MPRVLTKSIGFVLLFATLGYVSWQALFIV